MSTLTLCGDIVKKHDKDRFLLSLFAPRDVRADLWALFALHHEIAKTREIVTETQLGHIRLQWWREEITKIYEGKDIIRHDVLQALAPVIKKHHLPYSDFEALLYAREFDLEDVLPSHIDGTVQYAQMTNAPLLRLAVMICGGQPEMEPIDTVAINYGLCGLLRAVHFHARQRRCYLPQEEIDKGRVRLNDLYEGRKVEGLSAVLGAVAACIDPLTKPEHRFLKAVQRHAAIHYKHLRACQFDCYHPKYGATPPFLALRLCFYAPR